MPILGPVLTNDEPLPRVQTTTQTITPPIHHPLQATSAVPPRPTTHRYPTRHSLKEAVLHAAIKHKIKHLKTLRQPEHLRPAHIPTHVQFAGAVLNPDTGSMMEYRHLIKDPKYKEIWNKSFANEIGRLAQGIRDVIGTNTIFFIPVTDMPAGRTATYGRLVCDIREEKTEKYRTRLTVGGNLICYPGNTSTNTADLTTAKLLFNSVISTMNAQFATIDIKNFYLNTPMQHYEYMKLPINIIPDEIIKQYKLKELEYKGFVYMEIQKGMYGLPQAGKIANDLLQKRLAPYGYKPCKHTPGLWKHDTKPIMFTLVVDDFGCKYINEKDFEDLVTTSTSITRQPTIGPGVSTSAYPLHGIMSTTQ